MPIFTTNVTGAGPAFNPADIMGIPALPGVCIVGVRKLECINGENIIRFCPLYVSQAQNLQNLIRNHRIIGAGSGTSSLINSCEEIFDFINYPFIDVYNDIELWHKFHWNWNTIVQARAKWFAMYGIRFPFIPPFRGVGMEEQKRMIYQSISGASNSLLYFNCETFYDTYLATFGICPPIAKTAHVGAIAALRAIGTIGAIGATNLANTIEQVKQNIEDNFCYAYCVVPDISPIKLVKIRNRPDIKAETKYALEQLGVYTYGNTKGRYNKCT